MKFLAQNIKIDGKPFPTIQSLGPISNLDADEKFGMPLLLFGLQVLITAAIVLALIFLMWGGISWVISGGEKTKLQAARNTVIFAIVGLVTSLLSFAIVNLIGYFFLGGKNIFGQ